MVAYTKIRRNIRDTSGRGAVYVANLPHGFYEDGLRGFFRQFGKIIRLKVARSNKNANPMGWAYIEFEHEQVAKVAAKTMHGYYIFEKVLKCIFIDSQNINLKMFWHSKLSPETCIGTVNKLKHHLQFTKPRISPDFDKSQKKKLSRAQSVLKKMLKLDDDDVAALVTYKNEANTKKSGEVKRIKPSTNTLGSSPIVKKSPKKSMKIDDEITVKAGRNIIKGIRKKKRKAKSGAEDLATTKPQNKNSESQEPILSRTLEDFLGVRKKESEKANSPVKEGNVTIRTNKRRPLEDSSQNENKVNSKRSKKSKKAKPVHSDVTMKDKKTVKSDNQTNNKTDNKKNRKSKSVAKNEVKPNIKKTDNITKKPVGPKQSPSKKNNKTETKANPSSNNIEKKNNKINSLKNKKLNKKTQKSILNKETSEPEVKSKRSVKKSPIKNNLIGEKDSNKNPGSKKQKTKKTLKKISSEANLIKKRSADIEKKKNINNSPKNKPRKPKAK